VLTVSDGVAGGQRRDESGAVLEELLKADGHDVARRVVADDRSEIAEAIEALTDEFELVLTTGGTGVAPRDVTPEATASVVERQIPGMSEAIRADAVARTPHGMLSRGVAGIRNGALVVNFPGSPGGCRDGFAVVREALPHAVRLVGGEQGGHRQT
jgi:molybdopterin adenylyltransferase